MPSQSFGVVVVVVVTGDAVATTDAVTGVADAVAVLVFAAVTGVADAVAVLVIAAVAVTGSRYVLPYMQHNLDCLALRHLCTILKTRNM